LDASVAWTLPSVSFQSSQVSMVDLGDRVQQRAPLCFPDFFGVVFDPAGLREVLGEGGLRDGDGVAGGIEDEGAAAGGSGVDGDDVAGVHGGVFPRGGGGFLLGLGVWLARMGFA
jgi:hypothetical protein